MPTCLVFAGPVKNNKYFVGNITNSIFFCRFANNKLCIRLYNYCGGLRIKIFSDNLLLFAVRLYGIP